MIPQTVLCALGAAFLALAPVSSLPAADAFRPRASFNPRFEFAEGVPGAVRALVRDSQQRWIVGGNFKYVNGHPRGGIARLDANGALDPTFAAGADTGFDGPVLTLTLTTGDAVLVGGDFTRWGTTAAGSFARIDASGTLDTTLAAVGGFNWDVTAIVVQPDGHLIVGGWFSQFANAPRPRLARLSPAGVLDTTWNAGAQIAGYVNALMLQTDGKLVVGLTYYPPSLESNPSQRAGIVRFNTDGTIDTTFGHGAGGFFEQSLFGTDDPATCTDLLPGPDNSIYVAGTFTSYLANGVHTPCSELARLTSTGLIDPTFQTGLGFLGGNDSRGPIHALTVTEDGWLLAAGSFEAYQTSDNAGLARIAANGDVDEAFGTPGRVFNEFQSTAAIATDAAGNLILGGEWLVFAGFQGRGLVQLEAAPAPVINIAPQQQIASVGGSATFSVSATGPDLTYQWFRDGESIAGATSATLLLTDLDWRDAGAYTVAVANEFGTVKSAPVALLGPNPAPTITTHPGSADVVAGATATLTVVAHGAGSLTYHWRHAGNNVANPTGATLTLTEVAMHEAGWYDVVVADGLSVTASQAGRVVVRPARYGNAFLVDPTFAPRFETDGGTVHASATAPDGSFYLAGDFTSLGSQAGSGLIRFHADGTPDTTFAPLLASKIRNWINAVVPLADGKLLIAGSFTMIEGASRSGIARLNADGSLDTTFDPGTGFTQSPFLSVPGVRTLAVQTDGRILVGGYFDSFDGRPANGIARLQSDGSYDLSFSHHKTDSDDLITAIRLQSDGRIIAARDGTPIRDVVRLTAGGSHDFSFVTDTVLLSNRACIVVQPDDRVLVADELSADGTTGYVPRFVVRRLMPDGTLDTTFTSGPGADGPIRSLTLLPDGKIIVGGEFRFFHGAPRGAIARLSSSGALDETFASSSGFAITSGRATVTNVAAQPDGNLVVAGSFTSYDGTARMNLARLEADGALDPTFDFTPHLPGEVDTIAADHDGRWIASGRFTVVNGVPRPGFARLHDDGTLDTTYVPPNLTAPEASAPTVRPDGRYWVAEKTEPDSPRQPGIGRLFRDGRHDDSFDAGLGLKQRKAPGKANAMLPTANGGVIAAGAFTSYDGVNRGAIVRIGPDGTLDPDYATGAGFRSFNGGDFGSISNAVLLLDGRLIAVGEFEEVDGVARNGLARLNANGALDITFQPVRPFTFAPLPLLTQSDDRVIASGSGALGVAHFLVRLDSTGALDDTFRIFGVRTIRAPRALAFREDGAILVAGVWTEYEGFTAGGIAVLDPVTPRPPVIQVAPQPQSTTAGEATTLTASGTGIGPLAYQWQRLSTADSALGTTAAADTWIDLVGATSPSYTIPSTQRFHGGIYRVVLTATYVEMSTPSDPVVVTVNAPAPSDARLLNLSTRGQAHTGDNVLIPGFVVSGSGKKRLLIRAVGPTLGKPPFAIYNALADPHLRLLRRNPTTSLFEEIAANDNWGTNPNAAEITQTAVGVFAFPFNDALDSALLMELEAGEYTVNAGASTSSAPARGGIAIVELYDADSGTPGARLTNISNRGFCGAGDLVMIPGFVISAEGPKTVLVRVVGPTLADPPFSVTGTMVDPQLEIYPGGASTPILGNDNWNDNPDAAYTAQVAQQVGAFPLVSGSTDAAFVVTLPPGVYTVVGSSANAGSTGVVLVEVYVVP